MTISALSRGSDSASTNACSRSRSDLSKSSNRCSRRAAATPQRARHPAGSCSSSGSRIARDRSGVAARVVMVGGEQLPAAPDARRRPSAGVSETRELGQLGGRPRRATRGRDQRKQSPARRRPWPTAASAPRARCRARCSGRRRAPRGGDGAIAADEGRAPPRPRGQQGVAEANALVVVSSRIAAASAARRRPSTVAGSDATASTIETVGSLSSATGSSTSRTSPAAPRAAPRQAR